MLRARPTTLPFCHRGTRVTQTADQPIRSLVALHPGGPEPAPRYTHGVTLRLHIYVSTDTPHTVAVRRPFSDWLAWCPSCVRPRELTRSGGDPEPSRPEPRHIDTQSHLPRPPPTTAHRETRLVYGLERASTAPYQSALGAIWPREEHLTWMTTQTSDPRVSRYKGSHSQIYLCCT